MGTSGYTACACRDCFETVVSSRGAVFCSDCKNVGCDSDSECLRDDAYGVDDLSDEPTVPLRAETMRELVYGRQGAEVRS